MSTSWKEFMKELEDEVNAEGPEAVKEFQELNEYARRVIEKIKKEKDAKKPTGEATLS